MSFQHHGDSDSQRETMQRFIDELEGRAHRRWPNGRTGPDDDGELSYAITNDTQRGIIRIEFSKPTEWIGLDLAAAKQLRDSLTERILALRGVDVTA